MGLNIGRKWRQWSQIQKSNPNSALQMRVAHGATGVLCEPYPLIFLCDAMIWPEQMLPFPFCRYYRPPVCFLIRRDNLREVSPALSIYPAILRGGWTPTWYTGAPGAALVTHCNSSHSCSHTLWAAPHPDGRDWTCSATPSSASEPWQWYIHCSAL